MGTGISLTDVLPEASVEKAVKPKAPAVSPEIIKWVQYCYAACEVRYLMDVTDIKMSQAMTRCAGTAKWRKGRGIITLSAPLWPRMSKQEQKDTTIHETCHIINRHLNTSLRVKPHGWEWKALMRRCGIMNPQDQIYHNIDRTGLAKTRPKELYSCACGVKEIGQQRAARHRNGTRTYRCLTCKQTIQLVE